MAKRIKKDFDKDKMYLKIMPSAQNGDKPSRSDDKIPPDDPALDDSQGEPRLHNYMEDMVLEKLEHTTKVLDACGCDRCRSDIIALALNQLPTAYAVTEGDGSYYIKKLRGTFEVKATAALIKAIQQVKHSPRH